MTRVLSAADLLQMLLLLIINVRKLLDLLGAVVVALLPAVLVLGLKTVEDVDERMDIALSALVTPFGLLKEHGVNRSSCESRGDLGLGGLVGVVWLMLLRGSYELDISNS